MYVPVNLIVDNTDNVDEIEAHLLRASAYCDQPKSNGHCLTCF